MMWRIRPYQSILPKIHLSNINYCHSSTTHNHQYKEDCESIFQNAVNAVLPHNAVKKFLHLEDNILTVSNHTYE